MCIKSNINLSEKSSWCLCHFLNACVLVISLLRTGLTLNCTNASSKNLLFPMRPSVPSPGFPLLSVRISPLRPCPLSRCNGSVVRPPRSLKSILLFPYSLNLSVTLSELSVIKLQYLLSLFFRTCCR